MINQQLYEVVRRVCLEIIEAFKADGVNFSSSDFLSNFSYIFVGGDNQERRSRILDAAFSPTYKLETERAIEAAFSNSAGGTNESYLCDAVDDFLNYVIPRIAGLADQDTVFDGLYECFDSSMYGKDCDVTIFGILQDVWDNSLVAVLPPGYSLRYFTKFPTESTPNRWIRDRCVPYFELSRSIGTKGRGRPIGESPAYFVFSYSTKLPKNKRLLSAAYKLRDDMLRKFVFSVRLLKFSTAYSDYRGFRILGHLSVYRMNLMSFPEDVVEGGQSRELHAPDGHALRRLLPNLASKDYGYIAILDSKIEDALRRKRQGAESDGRLALRVAIDQLMDYFQVLEAVIQADGSEYIALYSAVLFAAIRKNEDGWETFQFLKRMHRARNAIVHGRIEDVLSDKKKILSVEDVQRFRAIIHALATAYVMNGPLRENATMLALGQAVKLTPLYPETTEEMNEMRRSQLHLHTCW